MVSRYLITGSRALGSKMDKVLNSIPGARPFESKLGIVLIALLQMVMLTWQGI